MNEPAAVHERPPRVAGFVDSAVDRTGLLLAVAGAVLIGAALRVARLGERVLSFDEAYTVATAQRPFVDMLATFRFEANGTLYAVLLWPLLRISESEAMVRTPALIAGLATIPAVFWAARELVGHRAALVAAALTALSPALIGWSVYGRGYAFAILFAVLSFGCIARALDAEVDRPGKWRALFVLATLAMAYSSAVAAVTLLPVHAIALATRAGKTGLRAWARAAVALVAGILPLAILLHVESTYRDPLAWLWKPDLALVRRVGGELVAGPAFFGDAGAGLAAAILAAAFAVVLVGLVLSRNRATIGGWALGTVLGWAFFPPLLLFVVSQARPMLWGRYLGIVVPALAVLVAVLIVRAPKVVAVACGAALASVLLIASLLTPAPHNDFREAAVWLEAHRRPAEPIVVYPIEQLPAYAYYARTLRVNGDMPVEEWNDTRLPEGVVGYRRDYDWGDAPIGPPTDAELARLASGTGSLLLLTYPNLTGGIDFTSADRRGCDVELAQFDGLSAVSYSACRAGD
ncbi:MAG: glycosyltransferase family 39 protein [Actinomycetota bacterium]|nr:glycosyltransferase family 39 protein [Actinomycetota bacterium]